MSAELQTALVNEVLDLSSLFKQNCALKHGLPKVGDNRISGLSPDPPPPPQNINITNQIPVPEVKIDNQIVAASAASNSPSPGATVAADTGKQSLVRTVAPWLLSALGASGLTAAGLWAYFSGLPESPVIAEQMKDGSLFDWLETEGYHLPEGWPQ